MYHAIQILHVSVIKRDMNDDDDDNVATHTVFVCVGVSSETRKERCVWRMDDEGGDYRQNSDI